MAASPSHSSVCPFTLQFCRKSSVSLPESVVALLFGLSTFFSDLICQKIGNQLRQNSDLFSENRIRKKVNKLNKRPTTLSGKESGAVPVGKPSSSHTSVSSTHTSVFAEKVPHCRKRSEICRRRQSRTKLRSCEKDEIKKRKKS